jgi:hypothetical protein
VFGWRETAAMRPFFGALPAGASVAVDHGAPSCVLECFTEPSKAIQNALI